MIRPRRSAAGRKEIISPGKRRIVSKAALEACLRGGTSVSNQIPAQQQPLVGKIGVYGSARLLPETTHHVILADVEFLSEKIDGNVLGQVIVNVAQNVQYLSVCGPCRCQSGVGREQKAPTDGYQQPQQ